MRRVLPILFNTDMVRAILDNRKTVTRRVIKNIDIEEDDGIIALYEKHEDDAFSASPTESTKKEMSLYSRYRPGDVLYVRETWSFIPCIECTANDCCDKIPSFFEDKDTESEYCYIYRAGFPEYSDPKRITWHPSIHMPKEAARIWLKVIDVRAERLNEMTLDDFLKEGVMIRPEAFNDPENAYQQAKNIFIDIWDSTIKKSDSDRYRWEANPWTWITEFERCEKPEPCIIAGVESAEDKRPCIGYGISEGDDEPCEMCKGCRSRNGYEGE